MALSPSIFQRPVASCSRTQARKLRCNLVSLSEPRRARNGNSSAGSRKAKARLRDGAPLAAAAFDSGFYDQAHLTREFVRTYGFTPKAYKSAWSATA